MPPRIPRVVDNSDLVQAALQKTTTPEPPSEEKLKTILTSSYPAYKRIVGRWVQFSEEILSQHVDPTSPFKLQQLPTLEQVKIFLRWLVRTSVPILDDQITVVTLDNKLSDLKKAIKLHTDFVFPQLWNRDLKELIEKNLPATEGLSTKTYKKSIAPVEVTKDLLRFAWRCDEYDWDTRSLIQLLFAAIILTFMGLRPGEMVESDAWKGSNEGLLYKDFTLQRNAGPGYNGFSLHIRLRNRKGKRLNKSQKPVMILKELPFARWMCPVTHFLALALADGVFEDCSTIEAITARKPPPGVRAYKFRMKECVKELPIFRARQNDGTISHSKILTYGCLRTLLLGLGQRAGLKDRLTSYCFRRAYGNALDKVATAAQRRQLMGHTGEETFQFYISEIVAVDAQSMVLGTTPDNAFIEMNQSMGLDTNFMAPKPPGSCLTDIAGMRDTDGMSKLSPAQQYEIRRQTRNRNYTKTRLKFWEDTEGLFVEDDLETTVDDPSLGTTEEEHWDSETAVEDSDTETAVDDDLENDYQNEWKDTDDADPTERNPSRYLTALLRHQPDRRELIDMMFTKEEVPLVRVVNPMQRLADPSRGASTYSGVKPLKDGICPVCEKAVKTSRPHAMHHHLLQCRRRQTKMQEVARIRTQFENVVRQCQWNDCGHLFKSRTPGSYSRHMSEHIKINQQHQCLWDRCGFQGRGHFQLLRHVSQEHQVPNEYTTTTRCHYCYEHSEYFLSDMTWQAHVSQHLRNLNDFCGLIRRSGLVIVAAHCLFCLGNLRESIIKRFTQFHDVFELHRHMKQHLVADGCPSICPHPQCQDTIESDTEFWTHANAVHGIPPFGPKRKANQVNRLSEPASQRQCLNNI